MTSFVIVDFEYVSAHPITFLKWPSRSHKISRHPESIYMICSLLCGIQYINDHGLDIYFQYLLYSIHTQTETYTYLKLYYNAVSF